MPATHDCVRRLDGVTYLPIPRLAERVRVSPATVHAWAEAGAVRSLPTLRGIGYASVADTVLLRLETPKQLRARGVARTPDRVRRASDAWRAHEAEVNEPTADRKNEVWEATDDGRLLELFEQARDHEKKVTAEIDRLYEVAAAAKDYASHAFLEWFLVEQIEEEKTSTQMATMAMGKMKNWRTRNGVLCRGGDSSPCAVS